MNKLKKYINLYWKKTIIRLRQLNGTPYSIAAGFACGVAISFTPFIGLHLIIAAITAWIIRANIVASALGTIVGNPWTFPFIWWAVFSTGRFLLGYEQIAKNVDFLHVFELSVHSLMTFDFRNFGRDVWPILQPMMVGCIPYYAVSWALSYNIIKSVLDKIEKHRLARRKNK